MSLHTVRPLLQTQSDENNNRLLADILVNLRTIEHYNIINPTAQDAEGFDADLI